MDAFVELWIHDSRKKDKALSSGRLKKDVTINKNLVYYEIKLACIHGEAKFQAKPKG